MKYKKKAECTPDVIIIGGGLAGSCTGYALQKHGLKVLLIERHHSLAMEASGQAASSAHPILHRQASPKMCLGLAGFTCLREHIKECLEIKNKTKLWFKECAMLQLANKPILKQRFLYGIDLVNSKFSALNLSATLLETEQELREHCGFNCRYEGVYFPQALWVSIPQLCQRYLSHSNIKTMLNTKVLELKYQNNTGLWQVYTSTKGISKTFQAPRLVLCTANETLNFKSLNLDKIPLQAVRGQSFLGPKSAISHKLKCIVSYDGHAIPDIDGKGTTLVGASFEKWNTNPKSEGTQNIRLYDKLIHCIPELSEHLPSLGYTTEAERHLYLNQVATRVAFRCTSPDRLPLCGPIPRQFYSSELKNKQADPSLYISTAYGSHGLLYAPLCAEIIAAQICHEKYEHPSFSTIDLPQLVKAISPERYLN